MSDPSDERGSGCRFAQAERAVYSACVGGSVSASLGAVSSPSSVGEANGAGIRVRDIVLSGS